MSDSLQHPMHPTRDSRHRCQKLCRSFNGNRIDRPVIGLEKTTFGLQPNVNQPKFAV